MTPATTLVTGDSGRWTPTRKLTLLNRLACADEAGREALLAEHEVTPEEIEQWRGAYDRHGLPGLAVQRQDCR